MPSNLHCSEAHTLLYMDWRDFLTKMTVRLGPAILIVISFVAILLGIILHAISINEIQFSSPAAQHFDNDVIISDKLENLVWFLQITDIHISNRGHHDREKDLQDFARNYVDFVKPDVVLVTGDITDGRKPNTTFDSGPQLDEWQAYSKAVIESGALEKTNWLDVRGNHDNFNVMRPEDPTTLYRQYSVQGKKYPRNYAFTLEKDGKNYSFFGVDEVQTPGLKIPFNFIGVVKDQDLRELKDLKKQAQENHSQYKIWFAHYPTSSIASPNEGLRNIIDGPYLCGHFHTIGNLVLKMHATQQPGFAEVELGDWKYNRRLRLAAIDHQLFSLVDVNFKQLPIALMTNPKNAEYMMPKFEPVGRILNSTHIRVIAFSDAAIANVTISLNNGPQRVMRLARDPLYTLDWNPREYSVGLHRATIVVTDIEGKSMSYNQSFSMDLSRDEFSLGARILLRAYFKSSVMSIFFFTVAMCTLPLILLRFLTYTHDQSSLKRHYKDTFLFNLHLVSKGQLFWPLVLIPTWLAIGPLFIGRLLDEVIGACFVWGVLINSTFIHTGITYNVGSIFLLLVHMPMVILLTHQVSDAYKAYSKTGPAATVVNFKLIFYTLVTSLQLWMGYLLYSAYGFISLITSFPFTWCILIYAYCWHKSKELTKNDLTGFSSPDKRREEQQALTDHKGRDDKSSTSEHSTC